MHAKQAHKFEHDPVYHGGPAWHSARRGIGSNFYRLGVASMIIKAILRHSNVSVTEAYYIKMTERDAVAAMERFAAEITAHEQSDSNRTPNQASGTMAKSVN